ncbi:MAG: hypothetical protein M0021_09855 [Clostridia bacterium]|nr:hypothetical protein [Clostridia bacterium]
MKKVKVLVSIASVTWSYAPGDIAEIDVAEAERWVNAGIAEELPKPEVVIIEPLEKAEPHPVKRRKAVK